MQLRLHKHFAKDFRKLSPKIQQKAKIVIKQFRENPHDPTLHTHALSGSLAGKQAFSVTSNIRILFEEYDNYQYVTLLRIGTHNQVY